VFGDGFKAVPKAFRRALADRWLKASAVISIYSALNGTTAMISCLSTAGFATRRLVRLFLACVLATVGAAAWAQDASAALRARYAELAEPMRQSAFGRPLVLESADERGRLRGDIHGVMNHSYAETMSVLSDPGQWCEILILHLNTKYCRSEGSAPRAKLSLAIGRKTGQALQDTHRAEFSWRQVVAGPQYLDIRLEAPEGPLGTSNYRIALEAVPIDGNRTFLHLSYSYDYGVASGIAMRAYLATAGRSKIGFSSTGREGSGAPVPVSGLRGAIERNAMRYYLAIDSRLSVPPGPGALDKRLSHWFAATEQYARQLHEVERDEYVRMKREEYARQQQPI
jgi:hypothetical protein